MPSPWAKMSPMGEEAVELRESRKQRGAFFTPDPIARFIARWAVRSPRDTVLEPSTGEAVFLLRAGDAVRDLGGEVLPGQLSGTDIHADSVERARRFLATAGIEADLRTGDFFDLCPAHPVDAVIGNPPYIRYQDFTGPARVRAREAAFRAGVRLSALASSWAAFTVHASTLLAPGGRMGLVLPAELLSVNYAAPVRAYLLSHFSDVRLVLFSERVFPGVQEEVVLLLAEGYHPQGPGTDHFDLVQVADAQQLTSGIAYRSWAPPSPADKWTTALALSPAFAEVTSAPSSSRLGEWGRLALGAVTGSNRFFALSPQRARELGLARRDVVALCPPGSRHLRALRLTRADLRHLGDQGSPTLLFSPPRDPSPAGWAYVHEGEALGVDTAYKCRVREPWWRVPGQPVADLLVTYMNAASVALCTNEAGARHLNSVHGLFLGEQAREIPTPVLALSALNSVTALGSELVGRAYGGGILKVEPREAVQLPVPSLDLVREAQGELTELVPAARRLLRGGDLHAARAAVDTVLVAHGMVTPSQLEEVRRAHRQLAERRMTRGRTRRG